MVHAEKGKTMKLTINDWAQDCAEIGKQMRRFAHANMYLSVDEAITERSKAVSAIQTFAARYAMDYKTAESIAGIISDSIAL
jgi:hypothetical protein